MSEEEEEKPKFDPETFERLVKEGEELSKEFDKKSAPMRQLTPEDWQRRSRDFRTWATEVSPFPRLREELDLDEEEEQALALFDMLAFTRWRRPMPNEIARSLIVVEPLPDGATPIYCHDFDVTSAVIGDDEDEE